MRGSGNQDVAGENDTIGTVLQYEPAYPDSQTHSMLCWIEIARAQPQSTSAAGSAGHQPGRPPELVSSCESGCDRARVEADCDTLAAVSLRTAAFGGRRSTVLPTARPVRS
mmetsp:Transcript_51080/g.132651  ORF Transcript_51080/g.132651 Transcript_51080/m.132651 type:complete len:111 (+) Transcript_51080:175-507(+)